MIDELTRLADKYGADKSPKYKKHSFTPYYFSLLKDKREKIKKVLEIGTGEGASLRMWRDFFPNALIYGADYKESSLIKEERIETFLCDQRRRPHLLDLIGQIGDDIDLVIDDGSHRPRDQIFTCLTMMPYLKKDAIYVIEDVFAPQIVDRFQTYDVEIPKLQHMNRYDNMLVVVRHKDSPRGISFFAKKPYRTGIDAHLGRVSTIIRAEQIANYIGANLNPIEGYQNDICIYVKPPHKVGSDMVFEGKPYLDIVDSMDLCDLAQKHPEVTVISLSKWNYKKLKKTIPNKVINIPQHHCNFERQKRNSKSLKKLGVIGGVKAFEFLPKGLKKELSKRNIEFIEFSSFSKREDIVSFYMGIDIQIVWRPYYDYNKDILVNPLKIVNASSFGIPTIAYAEPTFEEMKGCYIPVHTLEEFLEALDKLRSNPDLYTKYSKKCLKKAEEYHIEKIAKLYKNLAQ